MAGTSPSILAVQKLMAEIAPTDIPILIIGESGTGKEVAAQHIHRHSGYGHLAFAKINCANVSLNLPQAAFGNEEGAKETKKGIGVGTVFFDEIGDLDANGQRQLLHLLPDGNASNGNRPLIARVLSCTAGDPEDEVLYGRLRSELFYRLNGVCLRLPPLRRRKEDIPIFAEYFLHKYARLFSRAPMALSAQTVAALTEYAWPGNIRELENVIKKIVALQDDELVLSDLRTRREVQGAGPAEINRSLRAAARAASMKAERELILQALARTHWNRRRAAESLQISYKSLLYKLKQIQGLDSDEV